MNKEFVDLFFNKGILRLSSFRKFRNYPDEIRGDKKEGGGSVAGVSNSGGFQFHVVTKTGNDAYILCGSIIESDEIKKAFDCNSYLKIIKPLEFSVAISNAIIGYNQSFQGFCNYKDYRIIKKTIEGLNISDFTNEQGEIIIGDSKKNQKVDQIIGSGIDLMFLKEKKYQNQFEYRFIWTINSKYYQMNEFIDVECKEAIQFCEKLE